MAITEAMELSTSGTHPIETIAAIAKYQLVNKVITLKLLMVRLIVYGISKVMKKYQGQYVTSHI